MSELTDLIAKGKTAVDGYIGDIEKAEQQTAAAFKAKRAELSAALSDYKATHAAEVAAADALLTRAAGDVTTGIKSLAPAATLAASTNGSLLTKAKTFVAAAGWKGVAVLFLGFTVLKYLVHAF